MATTPIPASKEALRHIQALPSEPTRQTDELADVVIAVDTRDRQGVPWYVRLRVWLFCLLFLGLAECATRVAFDGTLCLHHERFDNFPNPAALDAFVGQIKRDKAFRVVVLGDSVVVGPSLLGKSETIPEYLEKALRRQNPGREIHVWNLGIAGARSTDIYCMLLKLVDAEPDLLVIESNFMVYTLDISTRPLANNWLAYSLPSMPDSVAPLVPPLDYKQKLDNATTWLVEGRVRFFGLRQAINGLLFGVQPRVPFEDPNPAVMLTTRAGQFLGKLPMQPWSRRGFAPGSFGNMYANPIRPDSLNGRFYRVIMQELRRRKVPAFFYLTPQNPVVMAACLPDVAYANQRKTAMSFIESPDFPSRDYSTLVPEDRFFDNDHLLAAGNQMLADAIARDMQPTLHACLDRTPPRMASAAGTNRAH